MLTLNNFILLLLNPNGENNGCEVIETSVSMDKYSLG